jgi:hypothetical protein
MLLTPTLYIYINVYMCTYKCIWLFTLIQIYQSCHSHLLDTPKRMFRDTPEDPFRNSSRGMVQSTPKSICIQVCSYTVDICIYVYIYIYIAYTFRNVFSFHCKFCMFAVAFVICLFIIKFSMYESIIPVKTIIIAIVCIAIVCIKIFLKHQSMRVTPTLYMCMNMYI